MIDDVHSRVSQLYEKNEEYGNSLPKMHSTCKLYANDDDTPRRRMLSKFRSVMKIISRMFSDQLPSKRYEFILVGEKVERELSPLSFQILY